MKRFEKGSKENIQFIASLVTLIAGITLLFVGLFLQPVGIIHYSVLTAVGMLLSFVGAVWNIDLKYDFKTQELRKEIRGEEERMRGSEARQDEE